MKRIALAALLVFLGTAATASADVTSATYYYVPLGKV